MARVSAAEAAKTREKLLDAALEVFWEEGVARPSLTKVAERVGMTRGAIYGHFRNKADLFGALCDRHLMPADLLAQHRAQADEPLDTLVDWVTSVLRGAREDRAFGMLIDILYLGTEAVRGDDVRDRLLKDSSRAREHERALLQMAVDQGRVPADLDVDLATVAVHSLVSGQLRLFALDDDLDPEPMLERVGPLIRDMVRSEALRRH